MKNKEFKSYSINQKLHMEMKYEKIKSNIELPQFGSIYVRRNDCSDKTHFNTNENFLISYIMQDIIAVSYCSDCVISCL